MGEQFKVITFYEFKDMSTLGDLGEVRASVRRSMRELGVVGTVIVAA